MKTVYFIIIILAAALAVMAWRMYGISHNAEPKADAASGATSVASARNTAIECIMTRSSVRSYTDRQVEKATVDTLLRAAMAAPTARDSRPWRFIVINERALLDTLAARCPNMSMAVKAPMAVVVCGDLEAADAKNTGNRTARPQQRICSLQLTPWASEPCGAESIRSLTA